MRLVVPHLGWTIIALALGVLGAVLVSRTLSNPSTAREVWFGHPPSPEPWEVIGREQEAFNAADWAAKDELTSLALTPEQEEAWWGEQASRVAAHQQKIKDMKVSLNTEKLAERLADEQLSVFKIFWMFMIFAGLGIAGLLWDLAFDFVMGLSAVKGMPWVASISIVGLTVLGGALCVAVWELAAEWLRKKSETRL